MMRVLATAAGNRLEVGGIGGRFEGGQRTVRFGAIEMDPDTARRAAVALIEGAAVAERRNRGGGHG